MVSEIGNRSISDDRKDLLHEKDRLQTSRVLVGECAGVKKSAVFHKLTLPNHQDASMDMNVSATLVKGLGS